MKKLKKIQNASRKLSFSIKISSFDHLRSPEIFNKKWKMSAKEGDEGIFEVEAILDKRVYRNKVSVINDLIYSLCRRLSIMANRELKLV